MLPFFSGVSSESIKEMMEDPHVKLVITDKGNGYVRHQLIRKNNPMDLCFKLNEQFSFYHPLLKEVVKVTKQNKTVSL